MKKLNIINPFDYPNWNELLITNKNYSFFHSTGWAKVLSDSYGYKPRYFAAIDQGELSVLIPVMEVKSFLTGTRGVSLPFTDFCQPIISTKYNNGEALQTLLEHGEKAGWKYLEIRGGEGFSQALHRSAWYYEHVLDLSPGGPQLFSAFRSSHKRNIKKSEKAGVEVTKSYAMDSMQEFCRLNCITRKMHGLPPQPFSFFRNIYQEIISAGYGFLMLASYQGKVIAANVYFHFGNKAIYKYGASDLNYQHLRPNNLVMWKAIEWLAENGFATLSFGRTDEGHEGLRQFKTGWGTLETINNYYRYNFHKNDFVTTSSGVNGLHVAVFRKTPLPILKMVGTLLYKHMA